MKLLAVTNCITLDNGKFVLHPPENSQKDEPQADRAGRYGYGNVQRHGKRQE